MKIRKKFLVSIGVFLFCVLPIFADCNANVYYQNSLLQVQFKDYMQNVHNKIKQNWTPPDTMENAHVTIEFKIDRRGNLIKSTIIESSGSVLYDESILDALKKAEPFDCFPNSTTRDFLTIKYNFNTSLVKTDKMKAYVEAADKLYKYDNQAALQNINLAIQEVDGDIGSYFLYGKRSRIKRELGDLHGAEEDLSESQKLKAKFDKRRILNCKLFAEMENSAFAYFYLANAYDIAGDYENAIFAIDKAINLTELNNHYKRYKIELIQKLQSL